MDWIDLAKDRDSWLTLLNAVMNLRFQKKKKIQGISWLTQELWACQEGLCSMELTS